jgi:hypothetical protein
MPFIFHGARYHKERERERAKDRDMERDLKEIPKRGEKAI